jgi:hypothetical protein
MNNKMNNKITNKIKKGEMPRPSTTNNHPHHLPVAATAMRQSFHPAFHQNSFFVRVVQGQIFQRKTSVPLHLPVAVPQQPHQTADQPQVFPGQFRHHVVVAGGAYVGGKKYSRCETVKQ